MTYLRKECVQPLIDLLSTHKVDLAHSYLDYDFERMKLREIYIKKFNLNQLYTYWKKYGSILKISHTENPLPIKNAAAFSQYSYDKRERERVRLSDVDVIKTIKFFHLLDEAQPLYVMPAPFEAMENDVTYRMVPRSMDGWHGDRATLDVCVPHTDPIYDYLDENYIYTLIRNNDEISEKFVITSELNFHTFQVFELLKYSHKFIAYLQDDSFINPEEAQVYIVKMEKKLDTQQLELWQRRKADLTAIYSTFVENQFVKKFINSEIDTAIFNEIRLTYTSAQYENITIKAENLVKYLQYGGFNFNGVFDVYDLISAYLKYYLSAAETKIQEAQTVHRAAKTNYEELLKAHNDLLLLNPQTEVVGPVAVPPMEDIKFEAFSINEIPIEFMYRAKDHSRVINGFAINKNECLQVLTRASCHTKPEELNLFLKLVSKMSIRQSDALMDGLPVKIHSNISYIEYNNPIPTDSAPKLRFKVLDKKIHLILSEEDIVRIKLAPLVRSVTALNKRIDNKWHTAGGSSRVHDFEYGRNELEKIINKCLVVDKNALVDVVEQPVVEPAVEPIGTTVPVPNVELVAGVTTGDAVVVNQIPEVVVDAPKGELDEAKIAEALKELDIVQAQEKGNVNKIVKGIRKKERKIQRLETDKLKAMYTVIQREHETVMDKSQKFLEQVITLTGATEVLKDKKVAYRVQGNLRSYLVMKETGQVFDEKSGKYICIVNANHYKGVGYDAIAARLLALKNDSKVTSVLGTLNDRDLPVNPPPNLDVDVDPEAAEAAEEEEAEAEAA